MFVFLKEVAVMSIFIEDDPDFYRRNSIFEEDCLDNEEYREYCETMNRLDAIFYGEEDYM